MGSWSVYCGISKITLTYGKKCVLLPIKVKKNDTYFTHLPATLPIFGEYDSYGGIENIEENENTKLIEKHFKCTIKDFCHFFTRGIIRQDEKDFPKKLLNNKEIKEWEFMFIDRQVYDYMSSYTDKSVYGEIDYGNPKILELLGFTYNGKCNEDRFNQEWEMNGVKVYSDGTWLHTSKMSYIYNFDDLVKLVNLPEDKLWMSKKTKWQLWNYYETNDKYTLLAWILDAKDFGLTPKYLKKKSDDLFNLVWYNKLSVEEAKKIVNANKYTNGPLELYEKYLKNISIHGNGLSELVNVAQNLCAMSGTFEPFICYLTPQDGTRRHDQSLLDKFAEINKSYLK